ncbi:MAG: sensor histidine kinase [bacterium]|nr:sensor histidine kinase [bacterium]MCM1423335.1 sensor histidine kinase [bacterium]
MQENNKRKTFSGRLIVWALCLAAGLLFLSFYPGFREQAEAEEPDILSGSEFLHEIYQANIVLYRQLMETVSGKDISWQDLYLFAAEDRAEAFQGEYYDFGEETPLSYAGEQLDSLLDDWDMNMAEGIEAMVDYEIIDNDSGKRIANTEYDLSVLGTEQEPPTAAESYPYFIRLEFDETGKLSHVWARGENADALLSAASRVMKSRYLERSLYESLSYSAYGNIGWDSEIYYLSGGSVRQMQLKVSNLPSNCTVCYAMTEAQLTELKASSRLFQYVGNYLNSGIQEIFRLFLLVLFVIALLLPFWKGYHLHEKQLLPLHFEVSAVLLAAAFMLFGEFAARLVLYSMSNGRDYSLPYRLHSFFPGIFLGDAQTIVLAGNLVLIALMFRLWFALIMPLCQVYDAGVRAYLKKHSLLVRGFRRLRVIVKRTQRRHRRLQWQKKYGFLLAAVRSISEGNLQTEFVGDWGEFEPLKAELSKIQSGFSRAVEEEVKSQRMRTELITNVSHDLKTPLTAIITYISLLQEEGITEAQRAEYLEVLERKSLRLKVLIEDLFELSKASSGSVNINPEEMDVCRLLKQVWLEYEDKAQAADLTFRFELPEEKVILSLDGEKTYRIFDNLYANIVKYAMPNSRVYIDVRTQEQKVEIEMKNISGTELNVPPERLTERFVRGDSARSTEGSGLGLAIANTLTELQGGRMEISVDGDLFKVTLSWEKTALSREDGHEMNVANVTKM